MLLFKLIVVILLLFVVISLFTALYRLNKDDADSTRVVKALSVRIGLSILLFILILVGAQFGLIQPNTHIP
ncbi:MAG: twin transmembrane helix small protein [Granulosicoccus sp.]